MNTFCIFNIHRFITKEHEINFKVQKYMGKNSCGVGFPKKRITTLATNIHPMATVNKLTAIYTQLRQAHPSHHQLQSFPSDRFITKYTAFSHSRQVHTESVSRQVWKVCEPEIFLSVCK